MRRARRLAVALAGTVLAAATTTVAASAWSSSATVAQQAIASATIAPPTGLAAGNGVCVKNSSVRVDVTWTQTTSTFADGYEILRSTSAGGPFTTVGTVSGVGTKTFTDTGTAFSTAYYYIVKATRGAWRSAPSSVASVTTYGKLCH